MKKEILWVVITAFGLGLIITYGILTARKALEEQKTPPQEETQIKTQAEPAAEPSTSPLTLTVYRPEDESVLKEKNVLCQGKTLPYAVIAILTEEEELILEADSEGNFETEISLIDGVNEITISAFDNEANEVSKTHTLVYTETEL